MIQCTTERAVQGIVNAGFGTVAKVDDGYYGQGFLSLHFSSSAFFLLPPFMYHLMIISCGFQGIYFTREMSYADKYTEKAANMDGVKAFIIAAVIVGNAFPVTEHPFPKKEDDKKLSLLGKPVITGYQSHYTVGKCSPCLML